MGKGIFLGGSVNPKPYMACFGIWSVVFLQGAFYEMKQGFVVYIYICVNSTLA